LNSNLYKFLNLQGFEYIQKNKKEFKGHGPTSARSLVAQCQAHPMLSARVWPTVQWPACWQPTASVRARHALRAHGFGSTVALAVDGGKRKGGKWRGGKRWHKGKQRGPHWCSRRGRRRGLVARATAATSSGCDALRTEEQRGWAVEIGTRGNTVRNRRWPTSSVQQRRRRQRPTDLVGATPCEERKGWVWWQLVWTRMAAWWTAVGNEVTMSVLTGGDSGGERWSKRSEALDDFNLWAETDAATCCGQVGDATQQAGPAPSSTPLTSGPHWIRFPNRI
jgi:hypothetical protein